MTGNAIFSGRAIASTSPVSARMLGAIVLEKAQLLSGFRRLGAFEE
jgi:hypothetical protein